MAKDETMNMTILILRVAPFADSSSDDEADTCADDPLKLVQEIDLEHMKGSYEKVKTQMYVR